MAHPFAPPAAQPSETPTLRERIAALRHVPPLIGMVWRTHRSFTVAMILLRIVRAFVPISALYVGKLIIDAVIAARDGGTDLTHLWQLVALEVAIAIVAEALGRASLLVESLLGDLFSNALSIRLMEHASTLDLAHFEDPGFYDHLERARRQTVGRIGLLTQLLGMAQQLLTLLSLSAAIIAFKPWLLVLLAVAVLPSFLGETRFAMLQYSFLFRWTPQRRLLDYIRFAGASDRTAKEVQMFGLAPWLTGRYRELSSKFYDENRRLSIRKGIVSAALSVFSTLAYYVAYVLILVSAVQGAITIGTLTFLASAFNQSRGHIQSLLLGASDIYEESLYLRDLFLFFEMQPAIASKAGARKVPAPIREGFVFEDVGFRYQGAERWAVRHVSFRVAPGERLALVGENGAGKTTLTKLIARLYEPTEGRILLDGIDLRDYDLDSLRRAIGVIFQDFVRYDMRFDENIGVGEIDSVSSHIESGTPETIKVAAEKSLATSLLPRLGEGYRQMLGRRFEGGVDLSGGEWQKVALARAYMRQAQLLILDEPTAALDARAEYEVFQRFAELVAGRMAVLISHRFSTVRMADRIVVLKDGEVVEDGSHEVLVGQRGLYSELFAMQAAGYR